MLSNSLIECEQCHRCHGENACSVRCTVAWIELTVVVVVVVVKVAGYNTGAIWRETHGLGFVVYHLGCSMFDTVGEHRIVIRSYGTSVVICVACYYVALS